MSILKKLRSWKNFSDQKRNKLAPPSYAQYGFSRE